MVAGIDIVHDRVVQKHAEAQRIINIPLGILSEFWHSALFLQIFVKGSAVDSVFGSLSATDTFHEKPFL